VGIEDTEDWLEICQDIGPQSAQSSSFAQAALKLAQLEKEHGLGYEEALNQYEQKLDSLKEMKNWTASRKSGVMLVQSLTGSVKKRPEPF